MLKKFCLEVSTYLPLSSSLSEYAKAWTTKSKFPTSLFIFLIFTTASNSGEISSKVSEYVSNLIPGEGDTEVSIDLRENNKPDYSILAVREIQKTEDGNFFTQFSFFNTEKNNDERIVGNLGFGKRVFSDDDNMMFGLNAFYDHEFDYDHSRTSLGAEIKSSYLELNYNQYFSNSNSKTGKNSKSEEAVDGYDLELGAQVPYIPSATFYTQIFEFDVPGGNDFEGFEYSTKLEVPNSGFTLELGHTDFVDHNDEWFFQFKYSSNKINKDRPFISDEVFEKSSVADQKYEKVRRENIIIKKGDSFVVKAGGF